MSAAKELRQRFRISQKMTFVFESWNLKDEELGRFLRHNGISSVELNTWKEEMANGMDEGKPIERRSQRKLEQRIASLEKELQEAKAIIELQKKAEKIWSEAAELELQKKSGKSSSASSKKPKKNTD